jgi:hypothetical protein
MLQATPWIFAEQPPPGGIGAKIAPVRLIWQLPQADCSTRYKAYPTDKKLIGGRQVEFTETSELRCGVSGGTLPLTRQSQRMQASLFLLIGHRPVSG